MRLADQQRDIVSVGHFQKLAHERKNSLLNILIFGENLRSNPMFCSTIVA
ncbi:MAG: hypothetical protein JO138_11030 [Acidobacteriaceae bacterium]|nr:hypothetical protein [Acidobacteriaceae bacterium]